jgi:hypothetical protein
VPRIVQLLKNVQFPNRGATDRPRSMMEGMTAARPLPQKGAIFLDSRGGDRALRVSWHTESGLVVLSLWRDNVCSGSFRLAVDEVPELIATLRAGLDQAYDVALGRLRHSHAEAG